MNLSSFGPWVRTRTVKHILIGLFVFSGAIACIAGAILFAKLFIFPFVPGLRCGPWGQPHTIVSNGLPLQLKWQFAADDRIVFAPHVLDGIVFIKTANSDCPLSDESQARLIALDAATGRKLWETSFTGLLTDVGPIVWQNVVIATVDKEGALRALDKSTGRVLWEIPPRDPPDTIERLTEEGPFVYVLSGIYPVRVYALDPSNGRKVWEQSGRFPSRFVETLVIHNHQVYVVFDDSVYVLDPKTGQIMRTYSMTVEAFGRPSYADSLLFWNPEQSIIALDLDSMQMRWQFSPECIKNLNRNEGRVRTAKYFLYAPSPIGDTVYTTGGCRVIFALDRNTGKEKWVYDAKGIGTISYVVGSNGLGYAMFSDWSVRALDLSTGEERGRLVTKTSPETSWDVNMQGLAAWDEMLYMTFLDRNVYAFGQ